MSEKPQPEFTKAETTQSVIPQSEMPQPVTPHWLSAIDKLGHAQKDVTLKDIFTELGEDGHYLLILFLCLPFIQPIPLLGLSTPLGFLIILVCVFLLLHKPPFLPKRYESLIVKHVILVNMLKGAAKIHQIGRHIYHERMTWVIDSKLFQIIGVLIYIYSAFLLALPLPIPFTNTIPAVIIISNVIGHLNRDGLFIIFSFVWFFIGNFIFFKLIQEVIAKI